MTQNFIETSVKQFLHYKALAERTFEAPSTDQLHLELNADVNSIAVMIQHISGNMLSRFTDFLNSDGEKPWRERDKEFESSIISKEELLAIWDKGWICLLSCLNSLKDADLGKEVFIRNQGHSVQEAITRQLCHYSYHIGQIILIGKTCLGRDWQSLSIPKGASQSFNDEKFAHPRETKHFTEDKTIR